jgi:predicted nuclease of predicted toxin-antitoxin system
VKRLLDANASPTLVSHLKNEYPDSIHVRDAGLRHASDAEIWDYARMHGFAIVSKDTDFRERSFVEGVPPKVIWLDVVEALLRPPSTRRGARRAGHGPAEAGHYDRHVDPPSRTHANCSRRSAITPNERERPPKARRRRVGSFLRVATDVSSGDRLASCRTTRSSTSPSWRLS